MSDGVEAVPASSPVAGAPAAGTPAAGASRRWAYAAAGWALVSAVPSVYWGLGGTAGLDTIGGTIERLARAHDPGIFVAVWVAVLLKVAGAALALALVMPWGRRIPRRLLLAAALGGAAVLTVYGGVLVVAGLLAALGLVGQGGPSDPTALYGHLLLWDPIFVVWGVLLGMAGWQARRAGAA
ncbi:DUF3995 domain-containing protein [Motilibacter deserti]|uniref:DUF3995 domain-containing protein n=1 Tax=Motilibacter deserti TaxID=2714956 RepID=A0ABX0H2Q9_9ACTN|nr:DUF3995 domain-containing protein [Motilibacter deserti]NHC16070.1 DUF3995 domain-containing protein [Motilibacter deserti]